MWLGIGDAVQHWALYKPNKISLRIGDKSFDFKSLYERAVTISNFVTESKIVGRVGVSVNDKFEYLACTIGLNLVGNSIIVLDPFADQESLKVHLTDTNPSVILGHPDLIKSVDQETGRSVKIYNISEIPTIKKTNPLLRNDYKEWGILFSSGSTGISKAIVYDHVTMSSELLAWCLELGLRRTTKFYIGRPIQYTGGLVLTLATLLVGGEVILPESRDDSNFESIWNHYQKCLVDSSFDFAFFIPDQLRTFMRIAKEPLGGPTILVMGAPISGNEKQDVSRILKSPVIESWGNSEGLGTITDDEDLFNRPGSIGRPFLTEKMYIVTDDLVECRPGESGRIAGSEDNMFIKYANRPDATKRVKRNSLILSDDIGYMDENGYFYILGRNQESFVIGGQTVFLCDIEERLRGITGIVDICIVALEEVKGAVDFYALTVSQKDNTSESSLKREIEKVVDIQLTVLFVDTLPRLSSGKIDRLGALKSVHQLK
jgi:acyl-coenzyme A synthetase/AMP-(fatty) acid ligase